MKITLATFLIFILTFQLVGNDGAYLTHGSAIYPTKETKISMDREILSFTVRNGIAYVNIQFEFYNPEKTERKLLLGFQAPSAGGDVTDSLSNVNQIADFRIVQNGQILPYTLKAAECEECELKDPSEIQFSQSLNGLFIYLFEITFQPGITKINHSYNFPASSNIDLNEMYDYILTTGSKWAGGKIKDLTVNIDMGQNQFFFVNDVFGKAANWSIIGTGNVTDASFNYIEENPYRMIRILSGQLQIKVSDFEPTHNIEFGTVRRYFFTYLSSFDSDDIYAYESFLIDDFIVGADFSKEQLRILRNTIYAQHGYVFTNKELKTYFAQFAWYIPDPNLKMENIQLTEQEKVFLKKIVATEKA